MPSDKEHHEPPAVKSRALLRCLDVARGAGGTGGLLVEKELCGEGQEGKPPWAREGTMPRWTVRIFEQNESKIVEADVFEGLELSVPDGAADLIFVDPPYNIGKVFNGKKGKWESDDKYLEWCYRWLALCVRKLSPKGSLYLMAATQNMPFLDIFLRPAHEKKLEMDCSMTNFG